MDEYNLDNQLALIPPLFLPLNIIPKYHIFSYLFQQSIFVQNLLKNNLIFIFNANSFLNFERSTKIHKKRCVLFEKNKREACRQKIINMKHFRKYGFIDFQREHRQVN